MHEAAKVPHPDGALLPEVVTLGCVEQRVSKFEAVHAHEVSERKPACLSWGPTAR